MGIFTPTERSPRPTDGGTQSIKVAQIVLPQQQPRRYFDPEKMGQLVQSVREHGILEPLLVRPLSGTTYELIAGERRYRAAKEVGLTHVPVVIREMTDQQALQVALIENLQREDLNPLEETEGMLALLAIQLQLPQADIAQLLHRLAKSGGDGSGSSGDPHLQIIEKTFQSVGHITWPSFATHRLPLLNLPEPILEALRQGKLEYTKARAIARVKDEQRQQRLLDKAVQEGLSLSQIQDEIHNATQPALDKKPPTLKQQFVDASSQLRKSTVWDDKRKRKRLEKLLAELHALLQDG